MIPGYVHISLFKTSDIFISVLGIREIPHLLDGKKKTLSKMFGLQIPSCLQWTGSILDEKGRKGLLWQRGL